MRALATPGGPAGGAAGPQRVAQAVLWQPHKIAAAHPHRLRAYTQLAVSSPRLLAFLYGFWLSELETLGRALQYLADGVPLVLDVGSPQLGLVAPDAVIECELQQLAAPPLAAKPPARRAELLEGDGDSAAAVPPLEALEEAAPAQQGGVTASEREAEEGTEPEAGDRTEGAEEEDDDDGDDEEGGEAGTWPIAPSGTQGKEGAEAGAAGGEQSQEEGPHGAAALGSSAAPGELLHSRDRQGRMCAAEGPQCGGSEQALSDSEPPQPHLPAAAEPATEASGARRRRPAGGRRRRRMAHLRGRPPQRRNMTLLEALAVLAEQQAAEPLDVAAPAAAPPAGGPRPPEQPFVCWLVEAPGRDMPLLRSSPPEADRKTMGWELWRRLLAWGSQRLPGGGAGQRGSGGRGAAPNATDQATASGGTVGSGAEAASGSSDSSTGAGPARDVDEGEGLAGQQRGSGQRRRRQGPGSEGGPRHEPRSRGVCASLLTIRPPSGGEVRPDVRGGAVAAWGAPQLGSSEAAGRAGRGGACSAAARAALPRPPRDPPPAQVQQHRRESRASPLARPPGALLASALPPLLRGLGWLLAPHAMTARHVLLLSAPPQGGPRPLGALLAGLSAGAWMVLATGACGWAGRRGQPRERAAQRGQAGVRSGPLRAPRR
jgi:hypothetical protein